ncbi:hypothetical protein [Terricaulis silvestris]|uniref:Uncharacterized protein n=1 Tax=Terricaulis silvestris TaxID=2686094 RepID=A0A6I6MGW6_9CAUL|nr:hypothetical protein [Terricaulis silvestris]QGZ94005.1 hypothetical protein DSM104635_00821 [Terricaulis silvestris]
MDEQTNIMVGVMNATVMLHAMLITELDRTGAISKADFGKLLLDSAKSAEDNAPEHLRARKRWDLDIVRRVVKHLDLPQPGWTPLVIDGDKT